MPKILYCNELWDKTMNWSITSVYGDWPNQYNWLITIVTTMISKKMSIENRDIPLS